MQARYQATLRPVGLENTNRLRILQDCRSSISRPSAHVPRIVASITLDVMHALRYYGVVIRSFDDPDTESLFNGEPAKRHANIAAVARRKLLQLEIAACLDDLRVPPGNRLEALKGKRRGQYSIRVNDQWRICFRWRDGGADNVEIVDYH